MKPAPKTPTLTILYHPVLHRIGERVILSQLLSPGQDVKISRNNLELAQPGQTRRSSLDEPHLSRTPFLLRYVAGGSLLLDKDRSGTKIVVDGVEVADRCEIPPDALDRGVIIELAKHVALLLHLHRPVKEGGPGDFGLIGHSQAIVEVREAIRRVAKLDDTVLIRGETGSGKELVAEAIHDESPRKAHDMISVNLGELPGTMAAAALFGATRGAYTGATEQKGYFRNAHGSTLFLDEIGEAAGEVQAMLLRVLEKGEIHQMGTQRGEKVDVRVIAATDADLEHRVESGAFREPLLNRLAGYEIHVPPLRQRRDDIGRLMYHFLGMELARRKALDRLDYPETNPWLPIDLVLRLVRCRWSGNVRQLWNAIRTLVIDNLDRKVAALSPQLERLLAKADRAPGDAGGESSGDDIGAPVEPPVQHRVVPSSYSDEYIEGVLRANRWSIAKASKALGITRATLYKRIEKSSSMKSCPMLTDEEIRKSHARCKGDIDAMVDDLEVSEESLKQRLTELGLAWSSSRNKG